MSKSVRLASEFSVHPDGDAEYNANYQLFIDALGQSIYMALQMRQ